jgi:hypothetical protein
VRSLGDAPRRPRAIFVTHGEPEAAAAFAALLTAETKAKVFTPALGDSFELTPELLGAPAKG